jgi:hypothetical protein
MMAECHGVLRETPLLVKNLSAPSFPTTTMSAKAGKKRASPGADVEKAPLQGAELGEEDAKKLDVIQREQGRAELIIGE